MLNVFLSFLKHEFGNLFWLAMVLFLHMHIKDINHNIYQCAALKFVSQVKNATIHMKKNAAEKLDFKFGVKMIFKHQIIVSKYFLNGEYRCESCVHTFFWDAENIRF